MAAVFPIVLALAVRFSVGIAKPLSCRGTRLRPRRHRRRSQSESAAGAAHHPHWPATGRARFARTVPSKFPLACGPSRGFIPVEMTPLSPRSRAIPAGHRYSSKALSSKTPAAGGVRRSAKHTLHPSPAAWRSSRTADPTKRTTPTAVARSTSRMVAARIPMPTTTRGGLGAP